ncbi:MAG: signal recognition particle protein [Candidatus Poribacteria bacterium]|nr:signal recognition particle protein [Candidatus Poribacteria bacterium]MDP6745439.1 signal recognition particle protein [Candidatus Poribacteria bacterium]MDP6995290.1 signal recognition particle protein [Candidatus Poribacteria bacterium]
MMFESLTEKLQSAFKRLSGQGKLTEKNVADVLREVRLALLEADVNFKVVRTFINEVRSRSLGQEVLGSLTPELQIAKIIGDELTKLMGEASVKIELASSGPTVVLMVGLQGSGKTTASAKLADKYKKEGRNPLLAAADIYRPAAIKQLQVLGQQVEVPVFTLGTDVSPLKIAESAVQEAVSEGYNFVIIDTAGRLHLDEELMDELKSIKSSVNPDEILLVVDSMTGQDAVNVAERFNQDLDVSGVVLTKLDGDARGGAALSIRSVTDKPIKLVSTGEKVDASTLEEFYPDRMASRILGQGDFKTLLERAEATFTEDQAKEIERKLATKQGLDFNDLLLQLEQIKQMGPLDQIVDMIPGVGKAIPKGFQPDEDQLRYVKAIIQSMTVQERQDHRILSRSRRLRIANGSGTTVRQVNQLVDQLKFLNRMTQQAAGMQGLMPNVAKVGGTKAKRTRVSARTRRKRRRR